MLSNPDSVTIVDYMKVADGEYVALFRVSLADAVYLDMDNQITLKDVMVNDPSNKVFHFVEDDASRFALSSSKVSNGDIVKVDATGMLYNVIDNTKLNIADGYFPFAGVIGNRSFRLYGASIAKTGWKTLATSDNTWHIQYYYDFTHPSITDHDQVDVDLAGTTDSDTIQILAAANEAVISSFVVEFNGYARLYSKYVPSRDLRCNVTVTKF